MLENPDRWRAYLGAATGSVGPDREPTPMPDQEAVFIWQLKLAAERGLPVSIHCLEAFGRLLELLQEHWRPGKGFLLHSYGGPAEMVPAFAKLGGYFGFPGAHLAPQKLKRREVFRVVPRDRLLVETDAPDQPLPQPAFLFSDSAGRSWNHPANLGAVYRGLADLLDDGAVAQRQQLLRVGQRHGVLELGPHGAVRGALDGQEGLIARDAHAHRARRVAAEVALPERASRR